MEIKDFFGVIILIWLFHHQSPFLCFSLLCLICDLLFIYLFVLLTPKIRCFFSVPRKPSSEKSSCFLYSSFRLFYFLSFRPFVLSWFSVVTVSSYIPLAHFQTTPVCALNYLLARINTWMSWSQLFSFPESFFFFIIYFAITPNFHLALWKLLFHYASNKHNLSSFIQANMSLKHYSSARSNFR